jgi:hypothetical protein
MRYDNKRGISIETKYPNEELNVTDRDLMNIFSLHEFSKHDGVASLTVGDVNIAAYYTGEDMDYYVVLILNVLENPEDYEEGLKKISQIILENLEEEKYIEMLPSLFTQLSKVL